MKLSGSGLFFVASFFNTNSLLLLLIGVFRFQLLLELISVILYFHNIYFCKVGSDALIIFETGLNFLDQLIFCQFCPSFHRTLSFFRFLYFSVLYFTYF